MAELRRTSWLRRGYSVRQVDAAVATVEAALSADPPGVTAQHIRSLGFSLRHHGYEIADVDPLLDALEWRCVEAELRTAPPWHVADRAVRALDELRETIGTRDTARFRRASPLRRGYDVAQVDALLSRCLDDLESLRLGGTHTYAPPPGRLNPGEVRETIFRRRRHGYREEAVDRAFDEVVDLLLRRDVLRQRLAAVPGAAGAAAADGGADVKPGRHRAEESSRSTG